MTLVEKAMRGCVALMVATASLVALGRPTSAEALNVPAEFVRPLQIVSPPAQLNRLLASTDRNHRNMDYVTIAPKRTAKALVISGPGWIERLWCVSDHPEAITVKLCFDSERRSLLVCERGRARFPPIAFWGGTVGEAYFCYLPIRVRSHATLSATNHGASPAKFFYQVNFRPGGSGAVVAVPKAAAGALGERWRAGTVYGARTIETRRFSVVSRPRRKVTAATLDGPAVLTEVGFEFGAVPLDLLRDVWLSIAWEGERSPSVRSPLPYLLCQYFDRRSFSCLPLEVAKGRFVLRLPMPFARRATIAVERISEGPEVKISAYCRLYALPTAPPPYRFHAAYVRARTRQGEPFQVLTAQGRGCLVGYTMAFDGLSHRTLAFLEGNDQIEVDGDPKISQEGTGTEDAFNSAWYFRCGPFARPFHGVTSYRAYPPRVSAYRFMFADRVGFSKCLKFRVQHGGRNSSPGCLYRAVVFWYQA